MRECSIPEWCKANCRYRDQKAKYMPACQSVLPVVLINNKCDTFRPPRDKALWDYLEEIVENPESQRK